MNRFFLGVNGELMKSICFGANLYKSQEYKNIFSQLNGNDYLKLRSTVKAWEANFEKEIEYFVVSSNKPSAIHFPFGISKKFQRIKTAEQVRMFSAKYGSLGFGLHAFTSQDDIKNFILHDLPPKSFDGTSIEPIEAWYHCAKKVRAITSLYNELKQLQEKNEELELVYSPVNNGKDGYIVTWHCKEDERISFSLHCTEEEIATQEIKKSSLSIGRSLLINAIKPYIDGHIFIDISTQSNQNSPLGVTVIEHKYTNSLITAIFYDLWLLLIDDVPIGYCAHCHSPFIQKNKRRKYCSDSCKTLFSRKRSENQRSD